MQPYQAATEEIRRQSQAPTKALKTAGAIAGSLAGGSAIAGRILPLISKFVPGEIMRKGLSKIDPRIGKFIDGALNNGYSIDDVRSFMGEKFSPKSEETPQESTQPQNNQATLQDFDNNYPMLSKALQATIQAGKTPQEAAIILKKSTALGRQVKDLESQIGKRFEDYVIELMGNNQQEMNSEPGAIQNTQEAPIQNQQQNQGVDPQLLQLVQGIRNSMKGLKGG